MQKDYSKYDQSKQKVYRQCIESIPKLRFSMQKVITKCTERKYEQSVQKVYKKYIWSVQTVYGKYVESKWKVCTK